MTNFTRLALAISLTSLLGCASAASEGSDRGDEDPASSTEAVTTGCTKTRAQILSAAAAISSGRRDAITRGFAWYDAHVPYSQTHYHEGYRTDCSGFVSMCWRLNESYTTADFSTGGGDSFALPSYASLEPGDALVRRSGGEGHIVLFLAWNDSSKSAACVLEQESTALDMQFHARTTSSLHGSAFKAIRADEFR
jgi:hypothetical protein